MSETNNHSSNQTKIILFGKNGQVAGDLLKIFADKKNFIVHNYSSKEIDFSDLENLKRKLSELPKADFIINATAYNAVDQAEDEPEKADLINHKAVGEIANYCQKQRVKFIHYSTNYVFDGMSDQPYEEDNTQNLKPLSVYAQSKLNGEKAVINSNCDYLILRLSTVFSLNKEDNFVGKIKKLVQKNSELKVVADQITNPTNSYDIAQATINIIEQIIQKQQFVSGIYHLASQEVLSYYDFAKRIVQNSQPEVKVTPVATDHFPTKATRPLNGVLNLDKIRNDFGIQFDIRL